MTGKKESVKNYDPLSLVGKSVMEKGLKRLCRVEKREEEKEKVLLKESEEKKQEIKKFGF
jgi:hypothetical protein